MDIRRESKKNLYIVFLRSKILELVEKPDQIE